MKSRLSSRSVIRARRSKAPCRAADFLRSWEAETLIPAMVRRKGGLMAKHFRPQVAAQAAGLERPEDGAWRPQTAGRNTGGRLFNGPPRGKDAAKK